MEDISLTISRVCSNLSIKVLHNRQTKRISEIPPTLEELKKIVKRIFPIQFDPKLYVINSDSNTHLNNENDYVRLINTSQSSIRLCVQEEKLNEIEGIIDEQFSSLEEKLKGLVSYYNNKRLSSSNEDVTFHSQCDICLVNPIKNYKYMCLICDDLTLCGKCECEHNHPVVKTKSNDFTTKEDICNLLLEESESKQSFSAVLSNRQKVLNNVKDKLFRLKSKFKVKFLINSMCHRLQKGTPFKIIFFIVNEGIHSIPPETLIYFRNTQQTKIKTKRLGGLLIPKSSLELSFEVTPGQGNNNEEILIEAHIYHKEFKIEYVPLRLKIVISDDAESKDVQCSLTYPGFSPEDTVSTLPVDKKEVLAEIIRKDLSTKDILTICEILAKYDWKLTEEAIEEMK